MSTVQSVERAFAVLRALAAGPAGVSDVAERTRLPKSTVSRLLGTLVDIGAVEQAESLGEYSLGELMLDLSASASPGRNLVTIARPSLEDLVEHVGEARRSLDPSRRRGVLPGPGRGVSRGARSRLDGRDHRCPCCVVRSGADGGRARRDSPANARCSIAALDRQDRDRSGHVGAPSRRGSSCRRRVGLRRAVRRIELDCCAGGEPVGHRDRRSACARAVLPIPGDRIGRPNGGRRRRGCWAYLGTPVGPAPPVCRVRLTRRDSANSA